MVNLFIDLDSKEKSFRFNVKSGTRRGNEGGGQRGRNPGVRKTKILYKN